MFSFKRCFLYGVLSVFGFCFYAEGTSPYDAIAYESLRIERDQLKHLNESLLERIADLQRQIPHASVAQSVVMAGLVGYSLGNMVLLFYNNHLLEPSLWSYWMRDFSADELKTLHVDVSKKLVQSLRIRYGSGDDTVLDNREENRLVLRRFLRDCISEQKKLEFYRTLVGCIKKVPGVELFFLIDPAVYGSIQERLERLTLCKQLALQALQPSADADVSPKRLKIQQTKQFALTSLVLSCTLKEIVMKNEVSAGALVYAYKHTSVHYLLLLYESGYWGFVKGKMETGETREQTAVRECREETGLEINLDTTFLYNIEYIYTSPYGEKVHKNVHLFTASALQKTADLPVVTLSAEHRGYGWFSYREALSILTHETSRTAFINLHQQLQSR